LDKAYASLVGLYRGERFLARFHIRVRYRRALLGELLRHVPESGSFLDIGCGHGVFANLLALTSAGRDVTGMDISEEKIAVARRTVGDRGNVRFLVADAAAFVPAEKPDVATILDALYLIPFDPQQRLIEALFGSLKEGGLLMINEVCRDRSWRFRKSVLQETVSVRLLGITSGKGFYYRSVQEWTALLEGTGFSVRAIPRRTPNPTHLFLCRKGEGGR
jgi:SAM-dependent methyltransferase